MSLSAYGWSSDDSFSRDGSLPRAQVLHAKLIGDSCLGFALGDFSPLQVWHSVSRTSGCREWAEVVLLTREQRFPSPGTGM